MRVGGEAAETLAEEPERAREVALALQRFGRVHHVHLGAVPAGMLAGVPRLPLSLASRSRRGVGLEIVRGRRAGGDERDARVRRAPRRRRGPTHRRGGARGGGTRSRAGARRARDWLDPRGERDPRGGGSRSPRGRARRRRRRRARREHPGGVPRRSVGVALENARRIHSSHEDECATRGARAPAADQIDDRGGSVEGASASLDANRFGFEERESLSTPDQLSCSGASKNWHPNVGARPFVVVHARARRRARRTRARRERDPNP